MEFMTDQYILKKLTKQSSIKIENNRLENTIETEMIQPFVIVAHIKFCSVNFLKLSTDGN